jgi:hypothetical protein
MISDPCSDSMIYKHICQRKYLLVGLIAVLLELLIGGCSWSAGASGTAAEAPEAETVLSAQVKLPFQVLIPAYLPRAFVRAETQVNLEGTGPNGELMVEIIYQTRRGETLTFNEWLPSEQGSGGKKASYCMCICRTPQECDSVEMGMTIGPLRVTAKVSAPDILTSEEARAVLDTMGPAVNRAVYSSLKQIPISYSVSPAIEIPINSEGVQEVTLVVTPAGYNPEHFSVRKDIPVRLIFRQLGNVGCGNQLVFQWGKGKSATLLLASSSDSQTLEFTPHETGEFRFNCPHLFYRGVMTVLD